jgi:hypothetical protein
MVLAPRDDYGSVSGAAPDGKLDHDAGPRGLSVGGALLVAALLFGAVSGVSAASRGEQIDPDVPLVEIAAYVQAKTAFERHCFRCHASNGEEPTRRGMEKLDMSRYPFTGRRAAVAGRTVRRALGGAGPKATMPKDDPDSIAADDLAIILKWADTFEIARAPKDRDQSPDAGPRR